MDTKGLDPMSEPSPHQITEAQYRAALVALGLDPDRVMSINLSPRWVMVTLVKLEDGLPVVSLGEVETEILSGPLVAEGGAA